MVPPLRLGVVVGLAAEAKLARALTDPGMIAISGATAAGAARAAQRIVARGATHLLSFGFAAGLDPALRSGAVLLPKLVITENGRYRTDPVLSALFGAPESDAPLLHSDRLVSDRNEKTALRASSGCAALDMESGAVALEAQAAGLPFAVLRTVCDPASTTLPPAARLPLREDGTVDRIGVLRSILSGPAQLPALIRLGRDVRQAEHALRSRARMAAAAR